MERSILIADKDKIFTQGLKYDLENDDYFIEIVYQGKSLLKKIEEKSFDLILLELDMPDIKGLELCKKIRSISFVPIIVITKDDKDMSKILALEYGADDYLVKPFNMLELKARIKSIFRRINYELEKTKNHIYKIRNFTINSLRRQIKLGDENINLTGKEFDLFYVLSSNPGKIFTREELLKKVWGYAYYGDVRTVDVHVRRIRKKIENNFKDSQYIMTKWGVGYYFNNIQ